MCSRAAAWAIAAALPLLHAQTPQALATFQLSEQFGVSWPDQPIEFRYDGGQPPAATSRMIGPDGNETPYQWVSSCSDSSAVKGCIAVRGGLPASANYTWTLQSGIAPSAAPVNPVQLNQVGPNYEITNGLTGIRIVAPAANQSPWDLAPIQGILLPGGVWTGAGAAPNLLYAESSGSNGCIGCGLRTGMYSVTGYDVSVVDAGPLKAVLKASYTFKRPQYLYGNVLVAGAGSGHYTMIVTMYANSKSVLIDEDSDMQFSYYLPLYKELLPDMARYRGHDSINGSGVPDPVCGYEAAVAVSGADNTTPITIMAAYSLTNGQSVSISGVQGNTAANGTFYAKTSGYANGQFGLYSDTGLTQPVAGSGAYGGGGIVKPAYLGQGRTPTRDALLDLTYGSDRPASYRCDGATYRKLMTDYTAATHASGWYVEMFNSTAGAGSPVVGIYTGRASQQVYSATGPSLPGIYTSNQHWISGSEDAGIQVDNLLRGPDASDVPAAVHRNWGIFAGTEADVLPQGVHQPIADEQNSLTGINLSRLYTYNLNYADPPGGWSWLYLSPGGANQLIGWVRDGTAVCGSRTCYFALLQRSESSVWGSALLAMWQGNSTAAVQTALNAVTALGRNISQTLAAGDNHFDGALGYYQLGLQTSPATAVVNAILMDTNTTAAQKATAKAALALFGSLFWDNDWFPIDNSSGESVGLANQIQQYLEYRTQSATADPSQPYLETKLAQALAYPSNDFSQYFSSTGAASGSTHYQSTFFEPLMLNYQNLSTDGLLSLTDPKWTAYANWELSIQTPPEPRFGNLRKGYSNGDGNTEADVRTGMLGTALYGVNPALGSNLMWAWQQNNSATRLTEDSQFVTTLATIDPAIPAIAPQLSSINIPGYHAAERFGFGTPSETAVWFIDGGFYSTGGHRHYDDGQVTIYALSAPLGIDWNANLYSPETPGRFMHNSVVYDNELPHLWNADNAGFSDAAVLLRNPANTEFATFSKSTTATANFTSPDGTSWTRSVRTMAFNPNDPIIYVRDMFAGPGAGGEKTLTWNLMAAGVVSTPAGPVTPVTRFSAGCQTVPSQLPSNGSVYELGQGLQQFTFTGASWPKHAAGGIDWDLYLVAGGAAPEFFIGNWGHGCHPVREAGEYAAANGTPFAESQHILRVHDTGPYSTILLPYAKGQQPQRTVSPQDCGVQIQQGDETTCFSDSAAQYSDPDTSVLTVYDNSVQSAFGLSVAGGPQEVTIQDGEIHWTISGAGAGARTLTLPQLLLGTLFPNLPLEKNVDTYTYSFPGGLQTAPVTIVFSRTPHRAPIR